MLHSPTLTTSYSAIAISTNEIAPPEELIERGNRGLGCKLQEPKYHVTVIPQIKISAPDDNVLMRR